MAGRWQRSERERRQRGHERGPFAPFDRSLEPTVSATLTPNPSPELAPFAWSRRSWSGTPAEGRSRAVRGPFEGRAGVGHGQDTVAVGGNGHRRAVIEPLEGGNGHSAGRGAVQAQASRHTARCTQGAHLDGTNGSLTAL